VTSPDPRARGRRAIKLTVLLLLVVLSAAGVAALVAYLRARARPVPTVAGWRGFVSTYAGDGTPGAVDSPTVVASGAGSTSNESGASNEGGASSAVGGASGAGGARGGGDGAAGEFDVARARAARFGDPFGVALDGAGNVYVADAGASNRVRKIDRAGNVSTLAGGAEGYADGAGAAAQFNTPSGLAIDAAGNVYVADTANNRVRKIDVAGRVSTLAGDGTAGHRDGPAHAAQFNGPVGVAVDARGNVFVADTYNDRVRVVTTAGEVRTVAGGERPGYADGPATGGALLDTPCGVAVLPNGEVVVADTGNERLRRLTPDGQLTTLAFSATERPDARLGSPVGLAATHDNFLYVTEQRHGRVWQIAPDGRAQVVAGVGSGFEEGDGHAAARFNQPAGLAVGRGGELYVADGANYLVRKVAPAGADASSSHAARAQSDPGARASAGSGVSATDASQAAPVEIPRLSASSLGVSALPWPLDPTGRRHEITATMGEVRGSHDTDDPRHHLHSGIDIFGGHGATARAVFDEKVSSPLPNWGFDGLNEGLRVGLFAYVHIRVGRDEAGKMFDDPRFAAVPDEAGKLARVRVRRGARFRAGDALGTLNRFYHVHLNFGPPGSELNPLALPFVELSDTRPPQLARDGVILFDQSGKRLEEKRDGRLVVRGAVRVVADAFDQTDGNAARRRLGLYRLGYQVLRDDGSPAPGFDAPRATIEFDRMPPRQDAVKIVYADASGITVYGSSETKYFYEVTNVLRGGRARAALWDTAELPEGDYVLRVFAADFAGNAAEANRDLRIRIAR
jgi:sugar lactone lactonase YvrE